MDIQFIQQLLHWMQQAQLSRLSLTASGSHITLIRRPSGAGPFTGDNASSDLNTQQDVQALAAGVFLTRHPSRSDPLVQPGEQVAQHDIIALLRIDTLFLPVFAPCDGIISEPQVDEGELVGYGTVLFSVKEAAC